MSRVASEGISRKLGHASLLVYHHPRALEIAHTLRSVAKRRNYRPSAGVLCRKALYLSPPPFCVCVCVCVWAHVFLRVSGLRFRFHRSPCRQLRRYPRRLIAPAPPTQLCGLLQPRASPPPRNSVSSGATSSVQRAAAALWVARKATRRAGSPKLVARPPV